MILLQHQNEYFNVDHITQIDAKQTGDRERTYIIFSDGRTVLLEVNIEHFLHDLGEVFKTNKKFTIFVVDRAASTKERIPTGRT